MRRAGGSGTPSGRRCGMALSKVPATQGPQTVRAGEVALPRRRVRRSRAAVSTTTAQVPNGRHRQQRGRQPQVPHRRPPPRCSSPGSPAGDFAGAPQRLRHHPEPACPAWERRHHAPVVDGGVGAGPQHQLAGLSCRHRQGGLCPEFSRGGLHPQRSRGGHPAGRRRRRRCGSSMDAPA